MGDLWLLSLPVRPSVVLTAFGLASGNHGSGASTGQPNWILALIIGAVVATLVDKYGGVILYPLRLLRKDHYLGEWWEYHLSYLHGHRTLRRSKLSIRRGLRTNVRRAHFWHIAPDAAGGPRKELVYKGTLRIENDQLLIEMDATTHNEHLVYRFLNRIPSNASVIPGIWMSFDHDSHPAAGAAILSDRDMTDDEAEKEILRHATAGAISIK
jgi:hypothetical protein